MKTMCLIISLMLFINASSALEEITPYKYTDEERSGVMPSYTIPQSSVYTIKRLDRLEENAPDIICYLSKPKISMYPIAILCGGSSTKEDICSIIHFHRYFLKELRDDLGVGVLTLEQWGVNAQEVNKKEYIDHYTRSQRLKDHQVVIDYLKLNPPAGWNGKFIFLGVSEGGPLVTKLTEDYSKITIATLNWSGAGDWSWREELWLFLQNLLAQNPDCHLHPSIKLSECQACLPSGSSRDGYDACMDEIIKNPTTEKYFLNMTYKYHADAQQYPKPDYQKIRTPFLVVAGTQDTILQSSDAFVEKARNAGVLITYFRENMDHYVRKKPEIIQASFEWLRDLMSG